MNPYERLRGDHPLVVYIDLKSPYAFIAIEPTRVMARAAGVPIEWRPFTLDIPSYLGSARLDARGQVVESRRTKSQWGGVRYAYRDARRYAGLAGKTLRGTEKIWDSSLAGIGLLWAMRQSVAVADRYLDACYPPFWQRALDIEDAGVIAERLAAAGADLAGFDAFLGGEGRVLHDRVNADAFAAGIFGVPSYLVADEFWFGREHLPRVAWLLGGRAGPAPAPAFPLPPHARLDEVAFAKPERDAADRALVRVAVDLREPRVALGWGDLETLAADCNVLIDPLPFPVRAPAPPPAEQLNEDRGTAHRRMRAEHRLQEVSVYATAVGLDLSRLHAQGDVTPAHLGLLWARRTDQAAALRWFGVVLRGYWAGTLAADDPDAIAVSLAAAGIGSDGFVDWCADAGLAALAACQDELSALGVAQVPTCLVGDELFQGFAHIPLLRGLLRGRPAVGSGG